MHQQAAKNRAADGGVRNTPGFVPPPRESRAGIERGNVERNSPPEKQKDRIKNWEMYYTKAMPLLYARCFGLLGASARQWRIVRAYSFR